MELQKKTFTTSCNNKPIALEVSRIAEQANAAVIGRYGQTTVLATVVMDKDDRDIDYLPLTVDYEEKFYAVGKILGSQYVRREGRASENAILSGRLIDRTIRPLFNQAVRRDIQVVITVLALDPECDPHCIGLLAASTALAISDVPWDGPVAGVTVAQLKDGATVINPTVAQLKDGFLYDLFAAGTAQTINMIELEAVEAPEAVVITALEKAQQEIAALIAFQQKIIAAIGRPKATVQLAAPEESVVKEVTTFIAGKLEEAVYTKTKMERVNKLYDLQQGLFQFLKTKEYDDAGIAAAGKVFEEAVDALVHKNILEKGQRPDFRPLDAVRELHCEVGVVERLHGSALFIRGNTQALGVTTLGSLDDQQAIESMEFSGKKRFLLHYNFPAFSTGETGSFRGPGRREIGHGALAEKALRNLIPDIEEFPYTIRLVSEILSSNGSSSMATVCAGCLSLMDAGVPIKKMAAGIAMGLITGANGSYKILTDIQGPEDHYGDMDFKAAGTKDGVTAIQMDVKIGGVTPKVIGEVLAQARAARLHILSTMEKTLAAPRPETSPYAPVVYTLMVDPDSIGGIIGPGGKTINGIIAQTGAGGIDIDQSGKVYIYGPTKESAQAALAQVKAITHRHEIGEIVEGVIVKILDFGAIIEFGPGLDGMIHVSELKDGFVKKVEDVVKVGDIVRAKIIRVENGKIGLSLKAM